MKSRKGKEVSRLKVEGVKKKAPAEKESDGPQETLINLPKIIVDPVESDEAPPEQNETVRRDSLEQKRFHELWNSLKQNAESSAASAGTLKSLEANLANKDFLFFLIQKLKELPTAPANSDDALEIIKKINKQYLKNTRRIR